MWHFCDTTRSSMFAIYIISEGFVMKKSGLFKGLVLGVACLLGFGGAVIASSSANENVQKAEASTTYSATLSTFTGANWDSNGNSQNIAPWKGQSFKNRGSNWIGVGYGDSGSYGTISWIYFTVPNGVSVDSFSFSATLDKAITSVSYQYRNNSGDITSPTALSKSGNTYSVSDVSFDAITGDQYGTVWIGFKFVYDGYASAGYQSAKITALSATVNEPKEVIRVYNNVGYYPEITITYGKVATIPAITETGYSFVSWNTMEDGSGMSTTENLTVEQVNYLFDNDIDFVFAQLVVKTYNVTFDQDGGDDGQTSGIVVTYGEVPSTSVDVPTKDDYDFMGYFYEGASTHIEYFDSDGQPTQEWETDEGSDVVLVAHWAPKEYTVVISAGEGVSQVYLDSSHAGTNLYASGHAFPYGSNVYGFVELDRGYVPADLDWHLISGTPDEGGAIYCINYSSPVTVESGDDNTDFGTVDAVKGYYPVTITAGPGVASVKLSDKDDGTDLVDSGSTFEYYSSVYAYATVGAGYVANSSWTPIGTEGLYLVNSSDYIGINEDFGTVYATAKEYTIHLEGLGDFTATYDAYLDDLENIPENPGYTFTGFYDAQEGGTQYIDEEGHGSKTWDKDEDNVQLYAHWTKDMTYTVTGYEADYDGASHSITITVTDPATPTIKYGTTVGVYDLDDAPTYTNVGSYTVFYQITCGDTYTAVIGQETVKINKVDRTTLTALISEADDDYSQLSLSYPDIADALNTVNEAAKAVNANDNKTLEEINEAASNLREAIDTAMSSVAISMINDIGDVEYTNECANKIQMARSFYDYMSDGQKALVPTDTLAKLVSAEKEYNVMNKIDSIFPLEYTEACKNKIDAARAAYDALSDTEKAVVGAYLAFLNSAERVYDVMDLINGIAPMSYTEACEDRIENAREAYEGLSSTEKALVSNYSTLTKAKADYDAVDDVYLDITAVIAIEYGDGDDIEALRAAYVALSDDQKAFFPEATLQHLEDLEAAYSVIVDIYNIAPVEYTEACEARIELARDNYDALTATQKALVSNYQDLLDAEKDYDAVDALVSEIEGVTAIEYGDGDDIEALRAAYVALTDEQEAIFPASTLQHLVDLEEAYKVIEEIHDILPLDYSEACLAKIDAALDSYDALTPTQKALVSNYDDLLQYKVDYLVVDAVVKQIEGVTAIEYGDEEDIEALRAAYVALTEDQKAFFPEATLQHLVDLEEAYEVIEEIHDIGAVTYTEECEEAIEAARDDYNDLTSTQKALVSNYQDLIDAERDFDAVDELVEDILAITDISYGPECEEAISDALEVYDLLTDYQESIFPKTVYEYLLDLDSAYDVLVDIHNIGEVNYTEASKELIEEAREAYDALEDDQKLLVTIEEYNILLSAEETYEAMDKINSIGTVAYTEDSHNKISEARGAYDALDASEKAMVDANIYKTLVDDEVAYDAMDEIHAIGTVELSESCEGKISAAREAYDALTADQKALVPASEVKILTDAEVVYEAMDLISDIGEVDFTYESEEAIAEARRYYNSLSDAQKAMVGDEFRSALEAAEAKYEKIEKSSNTWVIIAIILSSLAIIAEGLVIFFHYKKKKEKENGKKPAKALSIGGILPLIIYASHYGDGAWIVVYILIGVVVALGIAIGVIFLLEHLKKKNEAAPVNEEKEEQPKVVASEETKVEEESSNDEEEVITVTDEKGNIFQIRFVKSFTAKLVQSPEETKKYYEELKNEVLSYKKTTSRISWHYDSINFGRNQVLKFAIRGKTLGVYLPLNAKEYEDSKYKVEAVESKKYEEVPCLYRIKNDRRLGYAKDLIAEVAKKLGLEKGEEQHEVYSNLPYEENKPLIARGLIKELKVQVNKPTEPVILEKKVNAEGDEIVTTKDSSGNIFQIRFIKSFTAKLSQADKEVKDYYNILKNYVLSYKKANSRISWYHDAINVGRDQVLKFSIRGKTLCVYYALEADKLEDKYKVEKVESKKYEDTPCLYRIKNDRRCSYAKDLIDLLMSKYGVEKGEEGHEDYSVPYEETKVLLKKGLIKELKTKVNTPEVHHAITVEEADKQMSDETAEAKITEDTSSKKHEGKKGIINIDTIGENFSDGDTVDIEALWEKKLVPTNVGYVKVLARGTLNKKLNLDLQDYSVQAVKMILLEGGTVKKAK